MRRNWAVVAATGILLFSGVAAWGQAATMAQAPVVSSARAADQNRWVFVGPYGDVYRTTTPLNNKLHVWGSFEVWTSDYFRGLFDGVQEDCCDLSYRPTLAMTVEIPECGWFPAWTLTGGIAGALSDVAPFDSDDVGEPEHWYQADVFAGWAAEIGDFLVGITWTAYTYPNDIFGTRQEIAIAARYAGDDWLGVLEPQVKAAYNIESCSGLYLEGSLRPHMSLSDEPRWPIELSFPIAVGIGINDYIATEGGNCVVFGEVGAEFLIPLNFIPPEYGNWGLTAGVFLMIREDAVRDADAGGFDDGDNCILTGKLGLKWAL